MKEAFEAAFAEWQRIRQSEDSPLFSDEEARAMAPEDYGRVCAIKFIQILDSLAGGKPWDQIGKSAA